MTVTDALPEAQAEKGGYVSVPQASGDVIKNGVFFDEFNEFAGLPGPKLPGVSLAPVPVEPSPDLTGLDHHDVIWETVTYGEDALKAVLLNLD